ncbi:hypothetical protein D7147_03860 [Micromonospora musae]|uniref:SUKH-4 immunity protein n=1 Tax=Micromonospora musae TaxID=1894970 RepID=A0ABX9RM83_9ACTN|nr:hypothetical protein [Micromonospora musae]RKN24323.1 hypothetical protein D7147_03860 [Micromonospora musae]
MNPTQNQPHTPGALADLTPAHILRCAARYLELHGWHQGTYYSNQGGTFPPACTVGAIGMAAHGRLITIPTTSGAGLRDCRRALDYLTDYLTDLSVIASEDEWSTAPADLMEWNDRDDQDAATVINTLRASADNYDWAHATEEQLETYAEHEYSNEQLPTREGFLAWLGAR